MMEHGNTQKILVIVPAYNEAENICAVIDNIQSIDEYDLDIIVINDCSTDATPIVVQNKKTKIISLTCNLGIGGAVQTGYKYAYKHGYDIAIQVDGDGQHDPAQIPHLIQPILSKKANLTIGSRFLEKKGFQSTACRRIGINLLSSLIRRLTKENISDPTSGFRASDRGTIELFAQYYPIDYPEPESIITLFKANKAIAEVPVQMKTREKGKSSIGFFSSFYYMIKVSMAIILEFLRVKS